MTNPETHPDDILRRRNAYIIIAVLIVTALPTAVLLAYFGFVNSLPRLLIPAGVIFLTLLLDIIPIILIRRGRRDLAMMIIMTFALASVSSFVFAIEGRSLVIAAVIAFIISAVAGLAMSSKYAVSAAVAAILSGAGIIALDLSLGADRIQLPEFDGYNFMAVALMVFPIAVIFIRQYNRFNLQTKITLGIIMTGGMAVGIVSIFAISQLNSTTSLLSGRLETSVRLGAEEELVNRAEQEAGAANEFFSTFARNVEDLAAYRAALHERRETLGLGSYWNAGEKLIPLPSGQYGNSGRDVSSVFVPSTVAVDETVINGLNTSAYLDFTIPYHLAENPSILAIYAVDARGVIRYYPNIELATLLPPDFDATDRSYYKITAPLFNSDRIARWAIPYVDAAGGGLVVTVASPVYYGDVFDGIVAADIQLAIITEQLSAITVGESGYAFVVDGAGRLIYMPPAGYALFGIDPGQLTDEDYYKYSIRGKGSQELQGFTSRMVAGGKGLGTIPVNGVDTYISYAPIPSTGYSLGLVAPVSEMQAAIFAARQESELQTRETIQAALALLTATFIGALFVSIALGRLISSPLINLTRTANQIAGGDLTARSFIGSEDETGTLAKSFNAMADRLNQTLHGLEDRISERTNELNRVSQSNAYRASLFESIARISRAISSTRRLEQLLPEIVETISSQLGYYHVGIFLVDGLKEYAVLAAANSEGGKAMLERSHRLRVGETGIVGYVTRAGEARVALDVGRDAEFFNNPDLPETHSEIALPLKSGSEIIGALDVQSKAVNAFKDEDINILSVLADQVSTAIQNARSFQESHEAREQAERAAAQLGEQQWRQFLNRQGAAGFHFDGVITREISATAKAQPVELSIPIILRGVQIGTLKLSASDPDRKWDPHEIAMAQATAERTALAIENARLLEDAQKRAVKERTIGQISSKLGSLVNLDNIVQTTIQELGGTLPGAEVVIQFNSGQSG